LARERAAPIGLGKIKSRDTAGVLKTFVLLSASQGQEKAKENRDLITKQMSQSQIEEAQKLARECVKKNYKGC